MNKIKIGIIGTADIAKKRFLPALSTCEEFEYVGVASRTEESGKEFQQEAGGKVYVGYEELLKDEEIQAVYIPLPPALHYEWVLKALEYGKHVFCEKPFTLCYKDTAKLIETARKKGLAVKENYMFMFHKQIARIKELSESGIIGKLRLIRSDFCFPKRLENDFRYNKELGGGALFDCGGYVIKLITSLMGNDISIANAHFNYENYDVDLYGAMTMVSRDGSVAQVSCGMDNDYSCSIFIRGSKGNIESKRVFTAPAGFEVCIHVSQNGNVIEEHKLADDHFANSIRHFAECIHNKDILEQEMSAMLKQAELVEECLNKMSKQ